MPGPDGLVQTAAGSGGIVLIYVLAYFLLGGIAGLLAGLLGVGGGVVIVPALLYIFAAQQLPAAYIFHLALGTSLATIMFTSISSMRSHHRRGAVDWCIVRRIAPGILAGTFIGSWAAAQLSTQFLKGFFVLFLYYVGIQMCLDAKPQAHRQMPGMAGTAGVGALIGGISSLVGIGGGTMSVPFMLWCNTPLHTAIGTSAAIGFPIALSGAVGYCLNGFAVASLPPGSFGFIYLPALAGISVASVMTAPLGARLAHALPTGRLKKGFGGFVLVMATRMLVSLL